MAAATRLTASDLVSLVSPGGVVIAVTDDGTDPRFRAVRDAAVTIASSARARVLFFHAPPGQAGPGTRRWHLIVPGLRNTGTAAELEAGPRGSDLLGAEATEIRSRGGEVAVWMTTRPIASGMAEAVAITGAAIVLMPAEAERRGIVRRTLDYRAARIPAPVVAVDPDGGLVRVRPLGDRQAEPGRPVRVPRRGRPAERTAWGFAR
jgi:hypothetical protein